MLPTIRCTALTTTTLSCLLGLSLLAASEAAADGDRFHGGRQGYGYGEGQGYSYGWNGIDRRGYSAYGNGPYVYGSSQHYGYPYSNGYRFSYGNGVLYGRNYGGANYFEGHYYPRYSPYGGSLYSPYHYGRF